MASKLFKGDRVIWVIFMFLCLISMVEVFSATSTLAYKTANHWEPIMHHGTFLLGGFVIVLVLHNLPCRFFAGGVILLPVSVVLLGITLVMGKDINESSRWMDLFGVRFQPSEIAKLSLIIFISFMMSRRHLYSETTVFRWIVAAVGIVCLLILPENFSTAFLLFAVCFLLMFVGQTPLMKLFQLGAVMVLAGVALFLLLHFMPGDLLNKYVPRSATWQSRIERFYEPAAENEDDVIKITDDNYQKIHAKIAIARGGLFGRMPGNGQQRDFLPQAYADFIYAIIFEELGIVGGLFVLLLYIILMIRVGIIARRCNTPFARYLVMGSGLLIVVQALVNMSVAVDLIPVTGQPLPLISRGGTSTLINCAYIGMILSISRFGAGIGNEEEGKGEEEGEGEGEGEEEKETTEEVAEEGVEALAACN